MTKENYILILQKQLSGEITPEEQSQLDAWLAQSPDNQAIAKTVRKTWELSEGFAQNVELDLDDDFSKIEAKIGAGGNEGAKIRRLRSRRRWLGIAAALVLLIAAPFIIQHFLQPAVKYESFASGEQPAKNPIELLDGTKVWLNASSALTYFTTSVSGERRVKLEGEAFFDVAEDAERPFVVETTAGEVTVLGTSFSVKNFESVNEFTVHVATGKVKMAPNDHPKSLTLEANESGVFQKKDGRLEKQSNDNLNELVWHTRTLRFSDDPLPEALAVISRYYGVQLVIETQALMACTLTGNFKNKEFSSVKTTLETFLGAEVVEVGDRKFALRGGRCE